VLDGELHGGDAELEESASVGIRVLKLAGQQLQALGRHGGQQAGPVAEVMHGGGVGDAGATEC
jgi:hypothetical protein